MALRTPRIGVLLPPQNISPDDLRFDHNNPRMSGEDFSPDDQQRILEWLWRNKAVDELVDSIAANGYWKHEVLFAAKERGRLVVVEGNRRLAAVRILRDKDLQEALLGKVRPDLPDLQKSLTILPVIVCRREDLWQYVGFKHLNGPQEWDSIAKAEYIYRTRHDLHIPLEQIANTIGDRHDTVLRLYRGYAVLAQAEKEDLFCRTNAYSPKFPFSHLWTALGYTNVQKFLGLTDEAFERADPVPRRRLDELKELLGWLFGDRQKRPVVERQNPDLRNLTAVIASKAGLAALRAEKSLSVAMEAHLGDERLFQNALIDAWDRLRAAKRIVATGYTGDGAMLETADNIVKTADSLHKEMKDRVESKPPTSQSSQ